MYRFINLNNHNDYIKILNILEQKTKYIEFVLIDTDDTTLVDFVQENIYSQKKSNAWWGTSTSQYCDIYKIIPTNKLFAKLKKFKTFCILNKTDYGDIAEITDFGINDIAFFDSKSEPILFTTTHEGYISLRNDINF